MQRSLFFILGIVIVLIAVGGFFWRGTNTPEKNQAFITEGFMACLRTRESSWRGQCLKDLYASMKEQMSNREALEALSVLDDTAPIKQTCHILGHYIGQDMYRDAGDVPVAFSQCSQTIACGEGCYHGVVEAYMEETGDLLRGASAANLCQRSFTGNHVNYRACNHGIGHALSLLSSNDVPASLKQCDVLETTVRADCYSGVFMENVFGNVGEEHPTAYLRRDDLQYPCTILEDPYLAQCYQSQASAVLAFDTRGYLAVADFCAAIPEEYRSTCYREPGGDVVVRSSDPEALRGACAVVPEGKTRAGCVHEGLYYAIQMHAGNAARVSPMCAAFTNEEDRSACYRALGDVYAQWDEAGAENLCQEAFGASGHDKTSCIEGVVEAKKSGVL